VVDIDVKENVLAISGERTVDDSVGNGSYMRSERVFGKFARSFALPAMIPTEKITASFKDGVLKITIPKPEQEQPRRVSINVE
jgi:HSP20 family protein